MSQAMRWPLFCICAAIAKVLPPAPAQKSTTRSPGLAFTNSATSCEPSSWISISPVFNPASRAKDNRSRRRMPRGASLVASACRPMAFNVRSTVSRLDLIGLTLRSSGGGTSVAAISVSNACPKRCRSGPTAQSGHSKRTSWGMSAWSIAEPRKPKIKAYSGCDRAAGANFAPSNRRLI